MRARRGSLYVGTSAGRLTGLEPPRREGAPRRARRKQRAVEEPFAKDLQKEREALATAVANVHNEQDALQGEFQTLKQVSAELAEKIVRGRAQGSRNTGMLTVVAGWRLRCVLGPTDLPRPCSRRSRPACRPTTPSWAPK